MQTKYIIRNQRKNVILNVKKNTFIFLAVECFADTAYKLGTYKVSQPLFNKT